MATKKQKVAAGISAGVVAGLAAAGAGYYFYASKDAKKHRQIAAKWAGNLKKDVVKEVKKLQKIDSRQVAAVVDEVASAYTKVRGVGPVDLKQAAKELKTNWQKLKDELGSKVMAKKPASKSKPKPKAKKK